MAETYSSYNSIYQNLIDAGCDKSIADKCMLLVKNGKDIEMLPILAKHRKCLLDTIHKGEKQIDCLDYLIYSLKKQK